MAEDVQTTIHQAIESARFNDAVIVSVADEENNAREIVLVACLDKEHGGIVWRDASITTPCPESESNHSKADKNIAIVGQDDVGIIRHLRTKRWAVPMLNDHVRNEMYNRAVRDACRKVVRLRIQDPDHDGIIRILDIGSGTGLIAMMAAKHCRDAIVEHKKKYQSERSMKVYVTSCEMASAMARLARMTIEENKSIFNAGCASANVDCSIVVVEAHSTDKEFVIKDARFEKDPQQQSEEPKKADICTSELLDSGLLGEGVIPSLRDAWQRHLKDDATALPMNAVVKAVLVEGSRLTGVAQHSYYGPPSSSNMNSTSLFYGPELKSFQTASGGVWLATDPHETNGVLLGVQPKCGAAGGINVPIHAEAILEHKNTLNTMLADPLQQMKMAGFSLAFNATENMVNAGKVSMKVHPLTKPMTVLTIDFANGLDSFCSKTDQETIFVPTRSGHVDGVLFWWELSLGEGETYSTEPIGCFEMNDKSDTSSCQMQWQDHWQQCLYLFADGDHSREAKSGCPIQLNTSHDDYSLTFQINSDNDANETREETRRKLNDGSAEPCANATLVNKHLSSSRALQLNDIWRTEVLRNAVLCAINEKGTDARLLDLSDMSLCALIAVLAGKATCVTSLESNMAILAATISQIGNQLPHEGATFQIIQCLSENVTIDYIAGQCPAEIVVAEPYYQMLEGWHIQEALNYFYLVRSFRVRGLISERAVSVPALACIMACVVDFEDFRGAYGSVGGDDEMITGFLHQAVNYYGNRYHKYDVSIPLWQYKYKRISEPFCVAQIMYERDVSIEDNKWVSAQFERSGSADAVVVWVDYLCRTADGAYVRESTNERFDIISTSSPCHSQAVRKIWPSVLIRDKDLNGSTKICCRSKFDIEDNGGVVDEHSFTFKFVKNGEDDV
jgi:predicted RNA methylase